MPKKTADALRWILGILTEKNIDYQISGGLAAKLYGSSRELHDIDIDISEKHFSSILPELSTYITYGPKRLNDGKWDCALLTLEYGGQEIDLCGIDTMRMSNKERTKWLTYENDLSKSLTLNVDGIDLKVIHPRDLIAYKKELDGDHQLVDVQAVEEYAAKNGF